MDKTSKTLLTYLNSKGNCGTYWDFNDDLENIAATLNVNVENLRGAVRFLHAKNYIDYQQDSSGRNIFFSLSHIGINWRYFHRREILSYIADKWIDFFAALLSLISIVIAIIALQS